MSAQVQNPILVEDLYPSRFLRGADIPGTGWLVTISDVVVEELSDYNGQPQNKIVLALAELDKDMALNKTQALSLQDYYGADATLWVGQKIAISPERLKTGQVTIRITRGQPQAPVRKRQAPAAPEVPPVDVESLTAARSVQEDDDIPF